MKKNYQQRLDENTYVLWRLETQWENQIKHGRQIEAMATLAETAKANYWIEFGEPLYEGTAGIMQICAAITLHKQESCTGSMVEFERANEYAAFIGEQICKVYNGEWQLLAPGMCGHLPVVFENRLCTPFARVRLHHDLLGKERNCLVSDYWNKIPDLLNDPELPDTWPFLDLNETLFKNSMETTTVTAETFSSTCTIIGSDLWGWYSSKFKRIVPIHGSDGELKYCYPNIEQYRRINRNVCQSLSLFELKGSLFGNQCLNQLSDWADVQPGQNKSMVDYYLACFYFGQLIITRYGGQWVIPHTMNDIPYEKPHDDSRFEFSALLVKVSDQVFVDPFWCVYSESISFKDPLEKSPMIESFMAIPYDIATETTHSIHVRMKLWKEKYDKQNADNNETVK